jgi:hypothetical protein
MAIHPPYRWVRYNCAGLSASRRALVADAELALFLMQSAVIQFRSHRPVVSTGTVALCVSLAVHGAIVAWLLQTDTHRLALTVFGPLASGTVPELIELPDAKLAPMDLIRLPPDPPELALGAPEGRGKSIDETEGAQPQQARQADLEQPLLRINPGTRSNAETGAAAGTPQPVIGVANAGASADRMNLQPAAARPKPLVTVTPAPAAPAAQRAGAQSVVVTASAGSAAPDDKVQASKQPDAALAKPDGVDQKRDADALVGPNHAATVSPLAIRNDAPKEATVAIAGSNDPFKGLFARAQVGGAPDANAMPGADSTREIEPAPKATAQSTGPQVGASPTTNPTNSTAPPNTVTPDQPDNAAHPAQPTAAASAGAATANGKGSVSAPHSGSPGDSAPKGASDSDPFSTSGGSVVFRQGREDVQLGFKYRVTKPHILLKGWVDSHFLAGRAMTLTLTCDEKGNVTNSMVQRGSGSDDIDEPSRLESYNWWFEPPKDAKGQPHARTFPFTLRYYD